MHDAVVVGAVGVAVRGTLPPFPMYLCLVSCDGGRVVHLPDRSSTDVGRAALQAACTWHYNGIKSTFSEESNH